MAKITIGGMTIEATISEMVEYAQRMNEVNGVAVDAPEEVTQEETLKVGDYAGVIRKDKFNVGDIVYIASEDSQHFSTELVGDQGEYWHFADKEGELVKATAEEVAQALGKEPKPQRKPGEFKVGDIVRVLDGESTGLEGFNGLLVEVDRLDGSSVPIHVRRPDGIRDNERADTWFKRRDVELVCPAESRDDL